MEYSCNKRNKRRRRKRRHINKQGHSKFEVKSEKRHRLIKDHKQHSVHLTKQKVINSTMDANAFWENYSAAHEWQKRHNVTWWKTRCFALEHENYVLKETIRNLMRDQKCNQTILPKTNQYNEEKANSDYDDDNCADDNIEFHLNEDMMNFLAQSIRHKIELKSQKDNEEFDQKHETDNEQAMEKMLEKSLKRKEDAKSLYGEASTKILAMETALQTTVDRHVDKRRPQYWPNIPLKL